jgi:hypothetical protein
VHRAIRAWWEEALSYNTRRDKSNEKEMVVEVKKHRDWNEEGNSDNNKQLYMEMQRILEALQDVDIQMILVQFI